MRNKLGWGWLWCLCPAWALLVAMLANVSTRSVGPQQSATGKRAEPEQVARKPAAPARCRFVFELPEEASTTSGGVVDAEGRLVRTLWTVERRSAGRHEVEWDGFDELGRPAAPGNYRLRVILNGSVYRNVGTLGNTGRPPGEPQHIQHSVLSLAVGDNGNIFTANGWEEAGHDFNVMDPGGRTLFHARFQIRNGNPNGGPYAIAVDGTHIYCAVSGWANEHSKSKQQIQRFRITDGKHEPFTDPALGPTAGHIELYEWPERRIPDGTSQEDAAMMRQPIRALAIAGETLFAVDCLGNKVHKFHKVTGARQGDFTVKFPHALAIDRQGRLWVGHEHGKITVFDATGKEQGIRLDGQGDIRSLSFNSDGRLLIVADAKANVVRFFDTSKNPPSPAGSFGGPAQLGQYAPNRFDELRGAAMDANGNLIVIDGVRGGGARITKFSAEGKCLWDHMGLVFCETGNYSSRRPDEFLTQRFHRLRLIDKNAGTWEFQGSALDGDPKLLWGPHGVLRFVELGGSEFVFQCYGDGMQVYRARDGVYRLTAMVGGHEPSPDGRFNHDLPAEQRKPYPGLWSWTDANGNGKIDPAEVTWFEQPGKAAYATFGMNVDRKGTILYCEHHSRGIWELPVARLDSAGNPVYDWRQARQLVPRDDTPTKFFPLMAVRSEDGGIYAMGRSELWPAPGGKEAGYIWMGGWALAKYDARGRRQWIVKVPVVCPGLCEIPGGKGGVMLGYYREGHILHYEPSGLLIGIAKLGDAAGNITGWMDATCALSVNRDPRDGWLDVFGEDSYLNRMIWYRVYDRDIRVMEVPPAAK